jgi:hypothetical protein
MASEVAGAKWYLEEATPNHSCAGRPYGPRRCGGPEHSAGYSADFTRKCRGDPFVSLRRRHHHHKQVSAQIAKRKLLIVEARRGFLFT